MPPSNSNKPRVLLLGAIEHAHSSWASIGDIADIVRPRSTEREEFLNEAASGSFSDCIVAYRTFESVSITGKIDDEVLSALSPSLRYICHNGAGYDQVDIQACTARGVLVSNTPTAVDEATADMGIFLLVGALRNLAVGMANLRAGEWRGNSPPAPGHDPEGKILGILGMGGIGRNMARKASLAFGMKILYHNRKRLDESVEAEIGAEFVDFDTLLRESDVLSLNLPLNENTRHIISGNEFAKMKKGVTIINTARGGVMDEAALVDALHTGQVNSAGLDVYENEPAIHPGLLENPRVMLVPHMGTWTIETSMKMEEWAISNVRSALETGTLRTIVPEQRTIEGQAVRR
ncbi:D-isomer specific 2-hydroxyacid dehydrogenase [Rhypophila decipiens]|uniref:D-isomer specific 2-hydroxyacid dehydrogenase n=1 Tax=Rhypophila decipiens TaxID=261697 RepID=A0AAN6YFP5_9PEZI|nr:D-isomer specific 2-hydroxyacid dehydrogenase [Rhypophila decipiens]